MMIQLHSFVGHNDAVNVVAWNPNKPLQFASGSSDRRVVLWDIERLNLNSEESTGNEILVSIIVCSSYTEGIDPKLQM